MTTTKTITGNVHVNAADVNIIPNKNKYKYGAPMLVKEDTKTRLDKYLEVKGESYNSILSRVIDMADKYEKLNKLPEFHRFLAKLEKENNK